MSVVIHTNTAATTAARNLEYSSAMLRRSLMRLSSGTRIITAADDAGGLAVSTKLSAAAHRAAAAGTALENTTSYLQQQDSTLKSASEIVGRMSELWTLYRDPTKNATDLAGYDAEFKTLQQGLASLTDTQFNGVPLFGGTASGVVESVNASEDGQQKVALSAKDLASTSAGVGTLADSAGAGTLGSITSDTLTTALQNVSSMRANAGAEQSRLGFAVESLTTNRVNLEAAYSRIVDVDVAQESTELARWNLLVDAGNAMLAQANESGQAALRLIR